MIVFLGEQAQPKSDVRCYVENQRSIENYLNMFVINRYTELLNTTFV